MAKGGARPGAGRPRKYPVAMTIPASPSAVQQLMPLDFLMAIFRDNRVNLDYRMRAAIAALPFCRPRLADNRFGKRDAALENAYAAGENSEWADELGADPRIAN